MSQPPRNQFHCRHNLKLCEAHVKCDLPAWGTAATSSFRHLSYLRAKGKVLQHFTPIMYSSKVG